MLHNVQSRVNISVYFNPEVQEQEILSIKDLLTQYREVQSVEYVSRDAALADFLASEGNDPTIRQAVDEIGENPLLASVVIRANKAEEYEIIASAIESAPFQDKINRVNYGRNKQLIDQLNSILVLVRNAGLSLGAIFVLISILITFNTIRMSMYAHSREFEIMRLVGASNLYVRMPSVFEGIFYGTAGALVTMILLAATSFGVSSITAGVFPNQNVFFLFGHYFFAILLCVLFSGILFGVVSSFIAIRRYLEGK